VDLVENLEWLLWPDLIKNLYKTTRQIKHAIQRYERSSINYPVCNILLT